MVSVELAFLMTSFSGASPILIPVCLSPTTINQTKYFLLHRPWLHGVRDEEQLELVLYLLKKKWDLSPLILSCLLQTPADCWMSTYERKKIWSRCRCVAPRWFKQPTTTQLYLFMKTKIHQSSIFWAHNPSSSWSDTPSSARSSYRSAFIMDTNRKEMWPYMLQLGPFKCGGKPGCTRPPIGFCGSPMAYIHLNPPFIHDCFAIPVCNDMECDLIVKQNTETMMGQKLSNKRNRICADCGTIEEIGQQQQMMACARCKVTYYCSKDCQRRHWPEHKKTCKPYVA